MDERLLVPIVQKPISHEIVMHTVFVFIMRDSYVCDREARFAAGKRAGGDDGDPAAAAPGVHGLFLRLGENSFVTGYALLSFIDSMKRPFEALQPACHDGPLCFDATLQSLGL